MSLLLDGDDVYALPTPQGLNHLTFDTAVGMRTSPGRSFRVLTCGLIGYMYWYQM